MVSKSALEQAELKAKGERITAMEERQQQNAEVRHGLFMILFAVIWGAIKLVFNLLKFFIEGSKNINRL